MGDRDTNTGNDNSSVVESAIEQTLGGGEGNATPDNSSTAENQGTQSQQQQTQQREQGNTNNQQSGRNNQGRQQSTQTQAQGDIRTRIDQQGNVINADTGEVIANAGAQRRMWGQLQQAQRNTQELEGRVRELTGELNGYRSSMQMLPSLGLKPDDIGVALQLLANIRKNPTETIKSLLTSARAQGHNVTIGDTPGLDMEAINQLLEAKLKPLLSDRETQQAREQALRETEAEYTSFMSQYPDAAVHEDVLAQMVTRAPQISVSELYFRLKSWMHQHQFDWSKPLMPQIAARQQNGKSGNAAPGNANRRPLPNGRGGANNQPMNRTPSRSGRNSDIVREALRDAGLGN
jgi:hypothetical protein